MNKEYIDKVINSVRAPLKQADVDKAFKGLENDRETAEELAVRLIAERGQGYIGGRGDLYKLFPDYIKNDGKMMEKCFAGYDLNPCPNILQGSKHQFILPTHIRDNRCSMIAFIDGKYYDHVSTFKVDMARVAVNPNNFLTMNAWYYDPSEKDIELLKSIAYRSMEVELEACDTDAEKVEYANYADELKKAIEEKIEKEKQARAEREDDPIENE